MTPFIFQSTFPVEAQEKCVAVSAGITSKDHLFSLLQQEIPLPAYFGNNWDALEECLSDLGWLPNHRLSLIHRDIPISNSASDQKSYLVILAECLRHNSGLRVVFLEKDREFIEQLLSPASPTPRD